ncbi:MAG: hypothetical protein LRY68_09115 [Sulfurospirillum sp.]|nr:hypothetical protein [Sulfurospirillum sp.]
MAHGIPFGKYTSVAFVSREHALAYAKAHKAEMVDFETLLHVTREGMAKDDVLMHTRFKKKSLSYGEKNL